MLNIRIICIGKLKEQLYTDAAKEYTKRLSGYCKPEIVELPEYRLPARGAAGRPGSGISCETSKDGAVPGHSAQVDIALDKERAAIESCIPAGAAIIVLCIEGRELDSPGLSKLLGGYAVRGVSRLCFIIGSSFGLHEGIKNRADIRLSLSRMTFPHNLARVMLLEQLYRAFQIAEGGKYHK